MSNGFVSVIKEENRRKLDRPITGVIHKDRIWEQWYEAKAFEKELPYMSQKDFLFQNNDDDPNRVMIDYRGKRKFTVSEFKEYVLAFEKAFSAKDYEVGDVVCTIALTTPELYAIKYAATSLGMITCNLNVFDSEVFDNGINRLQNQMEKVNPRYIFVSDLLEPLAYKIVNLPNFSEAEKIILPIDYSFAAFEPERILLRLKKKINDFSSKGINRAKTLESFLKAGAKLSVDDIKEVYEKGMPCNISFTSGTTGVNKAVLLSHDANNALAFQQMVAKMGMSAGDRQLALVPPFLAFWDADVVHAVLSQKGVNVIELDLKYENIPQYFMKHKNINIGIWSQYLWSSLLDLDTETLKKTCTGLHSAIVGGERCDIDEEERFYEKTGIIQTSGFGASEVNTTFSFTHPNCAKLGTAGIPLPYNNVRIVDDDFRDVTYGVPGRLLITGPCMMEGYYNRPDLTQKAMHVDNEGVKWYNTGDYAVMDSDGCLVVLDRYIPPVEIITPEGMEKINLLDLAENIKPCKLIKNCKLTCVEGQLLLHAEFRTDLCEDIEKAKEKLTSHIKDNLLMKHWPDYILVYDALPRTQVGKVDYKALKVKGVEIYKNNASVEKLTFVSV